VCVCVCVCVGDEVAQLIKLVRTLSDSFEFIGAI